MEKFDVVITGSGLGGLASGVILAKEGYKVCVLEKNKQIGGTLQTFVRDKVIFDSGVHYVGGLAEGQNLHTLFSYLGIMDKLKLRKLDEDVFDAIMFDGDPKVYRHAQGYDNFIKCLVEDFPEEEEAIHKYCEGIKEVCNKFPLYNLRSGNFLEKVGTLEIDTQTFLESITSNKRLQHVFAATSLLYAGQAYRTPLYVHALVVNSYIESSWRFVDGGSQIARYLSREIYSRGGRIIKNIEVVKLVEEGGRITHAITRDGVEIKGDIFISNVHPSLTLDMVDSDLLKKAFRHRIKGLENSISTFYVSLVMKKNTVKYVNHNFYYLEKDSWSVLECTEDEWPGGYAMYYTAASKNPEYAEGLTLMTYMKFSDVEKWKDTFNTVSEEQTRGTDYDAFKMKKYEKLMDMVEIRFPGLRESVQSVHIATPLTLRDYIGTEDGSLYGVIKDYREPMRSFISPRTKIPNLFLTGQNLNLHGVLGVTVSAVSTCSEILGTDRLIAKIREEA